MTRNEIIANFIAHCNTKGIPLNFVIGLETAARLHGLSMNTGVPVTLFSDQYLVEDYPGITIIVHPDFGNIETDGETSGYGLPITLPVNTVIDMFNFDRDPQTINESLSMLYTQAGYSWDTLDAIMHDAGIYEEYNDYKEDAEDHIANH